ncbi:MAG: hypothetical protein QM736_01210 [Vicinamibacterales bacterium]
MRNSCSRGRRTSTIDCSPARGLTASAIVEGETDAVLAASDVVLTASGTATVQAALHDTPMVVVYRVSALEYRIGRRFVTVDTFAMVNLIAGRRLVPELIQTDFTAQAVADEAVSMLTDPERTARIRQGLADVRARLGGPGGSRRAAQAILTTIRGFMRRRLLTMMLCGLLAAPATATVLVPVDLSELAHDASVIARGQVVAVEGRWTDDRRTIETLVTLDAETFLKGRLTTVMQFRVPGGTLGRYRNIVMGAPQFSVGQHVIVFLKANGPQVPYILGLSQGVYRVDVRTDGAPVVTPSPLMPGVEGPVVRGAAARQAAPLAEFERDVRLMAGDTR